MELSIGRRVTLLRGTDDIVAGSQVMVLATGPAYSAVDDIFGVQAVVRNADLATTEAHADIISALEDRSIIGETISTGGGCLAISATRHGSPRQVLITNDDLGLPAYGREVSAGAYWLEGVDSTGADAPDPICDRPTVDVFIPDDVVALVTWIDGHL